MLSRRAEPKRFETHALPYTALPLISTNSSDPPVVFTGAGFVRGMQAVVPTLPGLVAFAVAFGTAASQKGMTLAESVAMSFFVAAGASQMLSMELWRDGWTFGGLLAVALVTATVNARFILQGASLQPWLRVAPAGPRAVALVLLFDASWIVTERDRAEGGRDVGVTVGAALLSWTIWWAATMPGHLLGGLLTDPRRYALDLVMPLFFAAMAVPLWRGARTSLRPWLVAALVGLGTQALVPGYAFIVAGALAGAVAGAFAPGALLPPAEAAIGRD